jgi:hypothetical protein
MLTSGADGGEEQQALSDSDFLADRDAAVDARLRRAKQRVAALKGFYVHLIVFALVLGGLVVVNAATGGRWWVIWVFLGWGVGVLLHGLAVLGRGWRALRAWEERKIAQYLAEEASDPARHRRD